MGRKESNQTKTKLQLASLQVLYLKNSNNITLVNVYVDLLVLMRIAGTS